MLDIDVGRGNVDVITEGHSAFPRCVLDVRRSARAVVNFLFYPKGCGDSFHIVEAVEKRLEEEGNDGSNITPIGNHGGFLLTHGGNRIKLNGDASRLSIRLGENSSVNEFLAAIIGRKVAEFVFDNLRNNQKSSGEVTVLIPESWDFPGHFQEMYIEGMGYVCPIQKMKLFE